jgi:hypothetical protein
MQFRWIPLALSLALVSGGTSIPSTVAAVTSKCELSPKRLNKLIKKDWPCADQPYFKDITAWTAFVILFQKYSAGGSMAIAKHKGGYYLVLHTLSGRKGEYLVRAQEDPLMFKFQDGSEMKLLLASDTRSKRLGKTKQQFCGFYPITREQLESEGQKLLVEATQFFTAAEDEKLQRRAEETEKGKDFFRWPVKVDKGRFPHIAGCALEFE